MKQKGILNRDITSVLARMGHTDTIILADCGLPVPDDILTIDLSLELGNPQILTVLRVIANDMAIENMKLAQEIKTKNTGIHDYLVNQYSHISKTYISHEQLKASTNNTKAVIRTGEATPFANIILESAVIF